MLHHFRQFRFRAIDQFDGRIGDLTHVMWRDICCHTYRYTSDTVK